MAKPYVTRLRDGTCEKISCDGDRCLVEAVPCPPGCVEFGRCPEPKSNAVLIAGLALVGAFFLFRR